MNYYMKLFSVCFLCLSVVSFVTGSPVPSWGLFGNGDKPFFSQGPGFSRISTTNNNNISFKDYSRHYNVNIQKTEVASPKNEEKSKEDLYPELETMDLTQKKKIIK